jgi:hypothetical protein
MDHRQETESQNRRSSMMWVFENRCTVCRNLGRECREWGGHVYWVLFKVCEVEISLCPKGEVLHTLITSEALTSLHNLIKQDAHADDETSKQPLIKAPTEARECRLNMFG